MPGGSAPAPAAPTAAAPPPGAAAPHTGATSSGRAPRSTATRWSARRSRSAARPTAMAAPTRPGSTAAASRSTCSRQHGVALPREVRDQFRVGKSVKPEELRRATCSSSRRPRPGPSHVAIAIGGDSSSTRRARPGSCASSASARATGRRATSAPGASGIKFGFELEFVTRILNLIQRGAERAFRSRRRDVSFMNWRTCRSSSRVARRLLRHAQRLDLDAVGVGLARQLLGEPLDVALRKRREVRKLVPTMPPWRSSSAGEVVAQEIVDRRDRIACSGTRAPSRRPARRTDGRGSCAE